MGDVIDLTGAEAGNSSSPVAEQDVTASTHGYDANALLESDSRLQSLLLAVSEAAQAVRERQRGLDEANHVLNRLEKKAAQRRSHLIERAESRIDWVDRRFPWDERVETALREVFKINSFRPLQREALNAALSRRDVLAVMPTGSGKSLVFQLAAVVDRGITLVVTPLVALMEDQTTQLNELGIAAYMLDSNTPKEEERRVFSEVLPPAGKEQGRRPNETSFNPSEWSPRSWDTVVLFVTPERIAKSKRLKARLEVAYERDRLSRFCFDEVHCISQWGHDFRHDYLKLGEFRRHFCAVPLIAVTATATQRVIEDVSKSLDTRPVLFKGSIDRPNLFYEVRRKDSDKIVIESIATACLTEFKGMSGIVYVLSRKDCEEVALALTEQGVCVGRYHGDLSACERHDTYQAWMRGRVQVVVATIAFGLGINKPDVRFVIHHSVPSSLIGYYQESGRAGRDGNPAKCIMYWRPSDMVRLSAFVADKGAERLKMLYESCRYACGLSSLQASWVSEGQPRGAKRPRGSGLSCRRAMIAEAFGETAPSRSLNDSVAEHEHGRNCCDLCRKALNSEEDGFMNVTSEAQSAVRIIRAIMKQKPNTKLTLKAFADDWGNSGEKGRKFRGREPALPKSFSRERRLATLVVMVLLGVLEEFHVYTSYTVQPYICEGERGEDLLDNILVVQVDPTM